LQNTPPLPPGRLGGLEGCARDVKNAAGAAVETPMKTHPFRLLSVLSVTALVGVASILPARAESEDSIKGFMKSCHKAPKGVDPICKKAVQGTASPEEIKRLIAGYKMMAKEKPEKGDLASWKEKTAALVKTSSALLKNTDEARAAYKQAVDCKACHSVHKED
jgi:hypothetical protein